MFLFKVKRRKHLNACMVRGSLYALLTLYSTGLYPRGWVKGHSFPQQQSQRLHSQPLSAALRGSLCTETITYADYYSFLKLLSISKCLAEEAIAHNAATSVELVKLYPHK
jgi:hypothetical protein